MNLSQIAAQLYTVRDHCKTAADFAASMKKIRAIGYQAVQVSGVGPIPEGEIAAILKGEGLVCCATHEPGAKILDETQTVVDRLKKLGCRYTAYPFPAGVDFSSAEVLKELVRKLDRAGALLRENGQVLGYHNHNHEFLRAPDGSLVLEYIFNHTAPENLVGEIDTYWIHYGGGSVLEWIERLRGRLPFLHLKDYKTGSDLKPTFCEVGRGTLNWEKIVPAAADGGCEWFIVEQDVCPGDPFESLKISYDYLKTLAR